VQRGFPKDPASYGTPGLRGTDSYAENVPLSKKPCPDRGVQKQGFPDIETHHIRSMPSGIQGFKERAETRKPGAVTDTGSLQGRNPDSSRRKYQLSANESGLLRDLPMALFHGSAGV
jgi:hypothetical protein